ncbi:RHS repeat-associated core domain-containing protein [Dyella psychrodurans]|uniref:RHS repeat-associated core domain-containing protein n=1 Tax=Dyella psychrodurans TaxID=1927960 RepID=A0A370WUW0_9GAMM|nr:RHS repeat-associated core domain-containing protein [Dyella psychrodurans]RDS79797.1 RHS repeat-associated core domain-containing protein [Dyella psychrodurans]
MRHAKTTHRATRTIWRTIWLLTCLLLCGVVHADKVTYILTDPNGTVLAEADAQGNITKTFDYRPYGQQALGQPPNGPGYTGHVNDPDTDLVYMQARYYDPETGRFLSVDPAGVQPGDVYGFNRYAYASNNPILNIDPNGRDAQLFWTDSTHVTLTVPYIVGVSGGAHLPITTSDINASFKQNFSGTVVLNGQTITVAAQAIEANGTNSAGHTNFVSVVPNTQGVTQSGRAETNKIGGDRVTVSATGEYAVTPATVSHEFGHVSGAGDQYKGGVDVNGNVIKQADSSQSGIMNSLDGGQASQQTMQEILRAPTNTNTCSPGTHAGNGGC